MRSGAPRSGDRAIPLNLAISLFGLNSGAALCGGRAGGGAGDVVAGGDRYPQPTSLEMSEFFEAICTARAAMGDWRKLSAVVKPEDRFRAADV